VFYLKTNRRRGGTLEKITCRDVAVNKAKYSLFEIDTDVLYEWADFPDYENRTTKIKDIYAENITAKESRNVIRMKTDPSLPPENIKWENLKADKLTGKYQSGK
jgi:polygalacturonase